MSAFICHPPKADIFRTYPDMTTEKLIEGLINQDKEAIRTLVNTFQHPVIKTAYYFVGNMEDAEDLSQEVMLEILRSIGKCNNPGNFKSWIYRITVNKSLDHLRRQKRRNIFVRLEALMRISSNGEKNYMLDAETSDSGEEYDEKKKLLDNAIDSLPENQKTALILCKFEELSYLETAEIMGLSLSSVESLIFRAKKICNRNL